MISHGFPVIFQNLPNLRDISEVWLQVTPGLTFHGRASWSAELVAQCGITTGRASRDGVTMGKGVGFGNNYV